MDEEMQGGRGEARRRLEGPHGAARRPARPQTLRTLRRPRTRAGDDTQESFTCGSDGEVTLKPEVIGGGASKKGGGSAGAPMRRRRRRAEG